MTRKAQRDTHDEYLDSQWHYAGGSPRRRKVVPLRFARSTERRLLDAMIPRDIIRMDQPERLRS
jgi:hypothetical protein